jgi:hypothetical protein
MSNEVCDNSNDASSASTGRLSTLLPIVALLFSCTLVGLWAVNANTLVYQHRAPFYDSMSYWERMHQVMSAAQVGDWSHAGKLACVKASTVTMPFLISMVASFFFEPTRSVGIWIQVFELAILVTSIWYFLRYVRALSPWSAFAFAFAFLLCRCLYRDTGGLSDFRMDLSLFLMFGSTCCWYLIAVTTRHRMHFILLGLIAGMCCLFRATAPVYLFIGLAPLAVFDLIKSQHRTALIKGFGISLFCWAVTCLWFYIINFEYLYYYYVVWNTDAQAKLSLTDSARHIVFTVRHVGAPTLIYIIGLCFLRTKTAGAPPWYMDHFLWKAAWIGWGPVLFLVVTGAGLNPYVCMPAVAGIVLACIVVASQSVWQARSATPWNTLALASTCMVVAMWMGWTRHHDRDDQTLSAHLQILQTIEKDAEQYNREYVRFGVTYEKDLSTASLDNTLRFDCPKGRVEGNALYLDQILTSDDRTFCLPAVVNWTSTPGENDADKVNHLVAMATRNIDYLIIPDEASADFISKMQSAVVNKKIKLIRQQIISSADWQPIGPLVKITPVESAMVYRNQPRHLAAITDDSHNIRTANKSDRSTK